MSTTVYQTAAGGALDSANVGNVGEEAYTTFPSAFHDFILSDSALIASYPFLKTCYTWFARGLPSVKVRVSALTASDYHTIVVPGALTTSTADAITTPSSNALPGSTPETPAAQSTSSVLRQTTPLNPPEGATYTPSQARSTSVTYNSPVAVVSPSHGAPNEQPQSKPVLPVTVSNIPSSSALDVTAGDGTTTVDSYNVAPSGVNAPVITLGGQLLTADSASNYPVGTQKLIPGGSAITINNVQYSLAASGISLVSASSTIALSPSIHDGSKVAPPVITIGKQEYTAGSASQYIVGTQTLAPAGQAVIVDGIPYSLAPSATAFVSGSTTIPLAPGSSRIPPSITVGGTTYTANSRSQYIIGSQTLLPGAPTTVIGGISYSLAPAANALVSGSITIPLSPTPSSTLPKITLDGITYTANSASQYIVGTQTIVPNGGSVVINSTPYVLSVGPSKEALIVGTSTSFISTGPRSGTTSPTVDFSLTPLGQSHGYVVDGQTLAPGSEITVGGTKISLGVQGTDVVVGSITEAVGLGGVILSGFGAGPTELAGNASSGVVAFTGAANNNDFHRRRGICGIVILLLSIWCSQG